MDIFATIQEDRAQFSPSEQRIADILLSELEFAVGASIIELAERAQVSPPTVTRFAAGLDARAFRISRSIWRRLLMSACVT